MRYFIELSYRGTAYHGWQTQANGTSVQHTLERALSKRLGKLVAVMGSGRTDAGVHAEQQFVHLDLDEPLDLTEALLYSLNCVLPDDIALRAIFPVNPTDHARFSAVSRYYEYRISRQKNAFMPGLTLHFRHALDIDRMNEACAVLLRHSDFKSLSKVRANVTHFRCALAFAYWTTGPGDRLTFHIKANRFLWGMVRTIVGLMLEIGQGRLSLEAFDQILLARDRTVAGRPAPANGLYLVGVGYPEHVLAHRARGVADRPITSA